MLESVVLWLNQISTEVFWSCAVALVLVDAIAVAVVMYTRNQALVNRWTSRVLTANLLLLGAGLGVPAAAYALKVMATALLPAVSASATSQPKARGGVEAVAPPTFP